MTPLGQDAAELLAISALSWLVENEELLPIFLGSTGASADDLRLGAKNPEFLASILDFLLMDDAWIQMFCETADYPLDFPIRARAALPGGGEVNWT
ncbi:MAG: DUF3572 domain-containing protein [Pseudomonadota bacterium]